ncbi:hypothetical protein [Shewanella algae]
MNLKFELKNPYPNTPQSIASEILQLLLVVERIKADKDSYKRLRSLARIRQGFKESPGVNSIKKTTPFRSGTGNLPLSTLCSVLDEGLGVTSFTTKSSRYAEYNQNRQHSRAPTTVPEAPEQHLWSKVWTEDIPAVIDSQLYQFENLNQSRLHYPHLQVLLAYEHGKELLLTANELMALDYAEFVKLAQEDVTKEFNHICNDKQNLSNLLPMLAQRVAQRATEKFLNEIDRITSKTKECLCWLFTEDNHFPSPRVKEQEKNWKNILNHDLGKQPVLSVDLLKADIQRAIKENNLYVIADKIANALERAIQPRASDKHSANSLEYQLRLMDIYESHATGRTQVLWHADNELQLNYNILLRGIGFSIWREKYQIKEGDRTAVIEAAKTFLDVEKDQPYCFGKPNTIKQSYEEVKGYAKRSRNKASSRLVRLIRSQMTTRLPFYTPQVRYVFAPFNIDYEEKIRDVAYSLSTVFSWEHLLSFDVICELFHSLASKDTPELQKDDLVKLLEQKGVKPSPKRHMRSHWNWTEWNRLLEMLRKDLWVGD